MFICHGAGEHCQMYSEFAAKLNESKMLVFTHDHGEFITERLIIFYTGTRSRVWQKLTVCYLCIFAWDRHLERWQAIFHPRL